MNIIVNGGSRGIGKEVALYLATDKRNDVIITGRDEEALDGISGAAEHKNISHIAIDLTKLQSQLVSIKNKVSARFDIIDILINNAGTLISGKFENTAEEEARTMMETNFFAPASLIKTFLPMMKKGSHIINISSMGGFQGSAKFRGLAYYSASKAALACLSECLATELGETGISINCLALGSVRTEMFEEAFPGYKASVSSDDMGKYIADFALNGNRFFNGKIIPVALTTP